MLRHEDEFSPLFSLLSLQTISFLYHKYFVHWRWHGHPKAQIFFDISGQKFHFSLKCAELVRAKMITAKKSSNKTNSHCRIVRPKSVMSRTKTKTDLRYPKRQRNADLLSSPSIFCYASIISQSETFYLSLTRKGGQRRFDLTLCLNIAVIIVSYIILHVKRPNSRASFLLFFGHCHWQIRTMLEWYLIEL